MENAMRIPLLLAAVTLVAAAGPAAAQLQPKIERLELVGGAGDQGMHNVRATHDGGWLVAGATTGRNGGRDLAVWKLNSNLSLDAGFGDGGRVTLGSTGDDQAADIVERLDATGRVTGYLVAGQVGAGDGDFAGRGWHGKLDLAFVGLDATGRLDSSFADRGVRLMGGSDDDEMVVHLNNFSEPGLRLARTDAGFYVAAMTRSSDGDFPVKGMIGSPAGRDAVVLKIGADARPDSTFAERGVFRIGSEPHADPAVREANDFLFTVQTLPDGGVAAAGYTLGYSMRLAGRTVPISGNLASDPQTSDCKGNDREKFCFRMDGMLLRLTPQGRLLSSWGDDGVRFVGGGGQEKLYDGFVDHADRTLFVGRTSSYDLDMTRARTGSDRFDAFIGRLDSKGAMDRTFGKTGVVTVAGVLDERAARVIELAHGLYGVGYQQGDPMLPRDADDAPKSPGVLFLDDHGARVGDVHVPVFGKAVALAVARDGSVLLAGLAQRQAPGGPKPQGDDLFFCVLSPR
jgi:hypothetical protein